jgi:hypothetical protein
MPLARRWAGLSGNTVNAGPIGLATRTISAGQDVGRRPEADQDRQEQTGQKTTTHYFPSFFGRTNGPLVASPPFCDFGCLNGDTSLRADNARDDHMAASGLKRNHASCTIDERVKLFPAFAEDPKHPR